MAKLEHMSDDRNDCLKESHPGLMVGPNLQTEELETVFLSQEYLNPSRQCSRRPIPNTPIRFSEYSNIGLIQTSPHPMVRRQPGTEAGASFSVNDGHLAGLQYPSYEQDRWQMIPLSLLP